MRRYSRRRGLDGPALRLDFDLRGTAGYALAARALPLDLPANYEITFDLRGDAPINDFQVKLVDESGENVWWFRRQNFAFPREWQTVKIKKRQVDFAWGPTTDRTLRHVGADRIRRSRRTRWWRRLDPCRQSGAARTAARAHDVGRAGDARVIVHCRRRARPRGRRQNCDRVAERPCERAASSTSRSTSASRASSAASCCAGNPACSHRDTTCNSPTTAANGRTVRSVATGRGDRGSAAVARSGDSLRPSGAARWPGARVRPRRSRGSRSRVRRLAECVLRGGCARVPARIFSARLFGTTVLLDDRRRRRRQRQRFAVRGWRARSRARRLFDRTLRARRLACRDMGRRRYDAVLARRLPADPERDMASAALDDEGDGFCGG